MTTKSSIDFGSIILGKKRVDGFGTPEYESAREVEIMRLQVLAGRRLAREAERQRIRTEREARTRVQFEALREKRAEEYRAEMQRVEAQRQYQKHLERHRADKLRNRELAQQENRNSDPEEYQRVLEGGRAADVAALTLRAGSFAEVLDASWLRIDDMTPMERDLLRPAGFSAQELDEDTIILTTGEMSTLEEDPLRPGLFSDQELIRAQHLQESGEMDDLERDLLRSDVWPAQGSSAQGLQTAGEVGVRERHLLRPGDLSTQGQGQDLERDLEPVPPQCEDLERLSELEIQQRRERRHYTSTYFGV